MSALGGGDGTPWIRRDWDQPCSLEAGFVCKNSKAFGTPIAEHQLIREIAKMSQDTSCAFVIYKWLAEDQGKTSRARILCKKCATEHRLRGQQAIPEPRCVFQRRNDGDVTCAIPKAL